MRVRSRLGYGRQLSLTVVGRPVGGRVPTEVQHAVQGVRLHCRLEQVAQELGVAAARRLVQRGPSLRVSAQSRGPVLQQGAHTALTAHHGLPRDTEAHRVAGNPKVAGSIPGSS